MTTEPVPEPLAPFVDVGGALSPAEAGTLEYELGQRGVAVRLRICPRDAKGLDRQAVQVAEKDLALAQSVRDLLFPRRTAPEPPPSSRGRRLRNGAIAGGLALVASLKVVRLVHVPKGPTTAMVVIGVAAALFAAAFGLTREPPTG